MTDPLLTQSLDIISWFSWLHRLLASIDCEFIRICETPQLVRRRCLVQSRRSTQRRVDIVQFRLLIIFAHEQYPAQNIEARTVEAATTYQVYTIARTVVRTSYCCSRSRGAVVAAIAAAAVAGATCYCCCGQKITRKKERTL